MIDQKWLANNSRLDKKKYTTQPLYLIQDSTITTAIDIIKPSKHSIITSACPHAPASQFPARQPF